MSVTVVTVIDHEALGSPGLIFKQEIKAVCRLRVIVPRHVTCGAHCCVPKVELFLTRTKHIPFAHDKGTSQTKPFFI